MENIEIVPPPVPPPSPRRRRSLCEKLAEGGFMFIFDAYSADNVTQFWKCDKSNKNLSRCRARLHIRDGVIVNRVGDHCHESNPARVGAFAFRRELGRRAIETAELRFHLLL